MIRIATSIPDAFVRRADYVFHQFGERWGIPVRVSHDGDGRDADLRYGAFRAPEGGRAAVDVPFDERLYEPDCVCAPRSDDGIAVWDAAERDGRAPDLVGSSYRLLTLLDEQQVDPAQRDRRGVFLTSALPAGRHKVAALPLVDDQAALLLQRLERIRPGLTASAVPRWPDGQALRDRGDA